MLTRLKTILITGLTTVVIIPPGSGLPVYTVSSFEQDNECAEVGVWNEDTSTCVLSRDISGFLVIKGEGVTLDGGGFVLSGDERNTGIQVEGDNATVKNLTIQKYQMAVVTTGDNIILKNITVKKSQKGIVLHSSGVVVRGSTFQDLPSGLEIYRKDGTFIQNNFIGNREDLGTGKDVGFNTDGRFSKPLPVGGNYWDEYDEPSEGCFDENVDGFCDDPYAFIVHEFFHMTSIKDLHPLTEPFSGEISEDKQDCCSNVAFLPGIQASRLYVEAPLFENQLWEPNFAGELAQPDLPQLALNENGESVSQAIYTRDIIDETFGFNIYKKFKIFMDGISGEGELINDWQAFPYDWRLPLFDILEGGKKLDDGKISYLKATDTPYIISGLRRLAKNSQTGKVTIIAHSNGGRLAKLLLWKLETEDDPLLEKIDKVILVATPQLGTPKAIASLLHGYGQGLAFGLLIDEKTARELAENMLPAYGLLPSKQYFNVVSTPVMKFTLEVSQISELSDLAGTQVDTYARMKDFLLGNDEAWEEPLSYVTNAPNVLDNALLARAQETHRILSEWEPPTHIQVIQIVGWGVDTVEGITYDDCDGCLKDTLHTLDYWPRYTLDGDGTVAVPSAQAMDGAETYYVELDEFNRGLQRNRTHASILEVDPLQKFIKNIIENNRELPRYLTKVKPVASAVSDRLRFSMHSPVEIDLYTDSGLHTGFAPSPESDLLQLYEAEIPNSYIMKFGETTYLGTGGNGEYTVRLDGLRGGTFTFKITQIEGGEEVKTIAFTDIPATSKMDAQMQIKDIENRTELKIDMNGDGTTDYALSPGESIATNPEVSENTDDKRISGGGGLLEPAEQRSHADSGSDAHGPVENNEAVQELPIGQLAMALNKLLEGYSQLGAENKKIVKNELENILDTLNEVLAMLIK